ncbi:MAG: hypothetical protein LBQ83_04275 [Candidatus Margulisbacteria bacterium]|jgi:hypothetical protein|nr:hypothetical protein [Candidatus Margulisiibacteriota bacterium]
MSEIVSLPKYIPQSNELKINGEISRGEEARYGAALNAILADDNPLRVSMENSFNTENLTPLETRLLLVALLKTADFYNPDVLWFVQELLSVNGQDIQSLGLGQLKNAVVDLLDKNSPAVSAQIKSIAERIVTEHEQGLASSLDARTKAELKYFAGEVEIGKISQLEAFAVNFVETELLGMRFSREEVLDIAERITAGKKLSDSIKFALKAFAGDADLSTVSKLIEFANALEPLPEVSLAEVEQEEITEGPDIQETNEGHNAQPGNAPQRRAYRTRYTAPARYTPPESDDKPIIRYTLEELGEYIKENSSPISRTISAEYYEKFMTDGKIDPLKLVEYRSARYYPNFYARMMINYICGGDREILRAFNPDGSLNENPLTDNEKRGLHERAVAAGVLRGNYEQAQVIAKSLKVPLAMLENITDVLYVEKFKDTELYKLISWYKENDIPAPPELILRYASSAEVAELKEIKIWLGRPVKVPWPDGEQADLWELYKTQYQSYIKLLDDLNQLDCYISDVEYEEITFQSPDGRKVSDFVLSEVFSRFCAGSVYGDMKTILFDSTQMDIEKLMQLWSEYLEHIKTNRPLAEQMPGIDNLYKEPMRMPLPVDFIRFVFERVNFLSAESKASLLRSISLAGLNNFRLEEYNPVIEQITALGAPVMNSAEVKRYANSAFLEAASPYRIYGSLTLDQITRLLSGNRTVDVKKFLSPLTDNFLLNMRQALMLSDYEQGFREGASPDILVQKRQNYKTMQVFLQKYPSLYTIEHKSGEFQQELLVILKAMSSCAKNGALLLDYDSYFINSLANLIYIAAFTACDDEVQCDDFIKSVLPYMQDIETALQNIDREEYELHTIDTEGQRREGGDYATFKAILADILLYNEGGLSHIREYRAAIEENLKASLDVLSDVYSTVGYSKEDIEAFNQIVNTYLHLPQHPEILEQDIEEDIRIILLYIMKDVAPEESADTVISPTDLQRSALVRETIRFYEQTKKALANQEDNLTILMNILFNFIVILRQGIRAGQTLDLLNGGDSATYASILDAFVEDKYEELDTNGDGVVDTMNMRPESERTNPLADLEAYSENELRYFSGALYYGRDKLKNLTTYAEAKAFYTALAGLQPPPSGLETFGRNFAADFADRHRLWTYERHIEFLIAGENILTGLDKNTKEQLLKKLKLSDSFLHNKSINIISLLFLKSTSGNVYQTARKNTEAGLKNTLAQKAASAIDAVFQTAAGTDWSMTKEYIDEIYHTYDTYRRQDVTFKSLVNQLSTVKTINEGLMAGENLLYGGHGGIAINGGTDPYRKENENALATAAFTPYRKLIELAVRFNIQVPIYVYFTLPLDIVRDLCDFFSNLDSPDRWNALMNAGSRVVEMATWRMTIINWLKEFFEKMAAGQYLEAFCSLYVTLSIGQGLFKKTLDLVTLKSPKNAGLRLLDTCGRLLGRETVRHLNTKTLNAEIELLGKSPEAPELAAWKRAMQKLSGLSKYGLYQLTESAYKLDASVVRDRLDAVYKEAQKADAPMQERLYLGDLAANYPGPSEIKEATVNQAGAVVNGMATWGWFGVRKSFGLFSHGVNWAVSNVSVPALLKSANAGLFNSIEYNNSMNFFYNAGRKYIFRHGVSIGVGNHRVGFGLGNYGHFFNFSYGKHTGRFKKIRLFSPVTLNKTMIESAQERLTKYLDDYLRDEMERNPELESALKAQYFKEHPDVQSVSVEELLKYQADNLPVARIRELASEFWRGALLPDMRTELKANVEGVSVKDGKTVLEKTDAMDKVEPVSTQEIKDGFTITWRERIAGDSYETKTARISNWGEAKEQIERIMRSISSPADAKAALPDLLKLYSVAYHEANKLLSPPKDLTLLKSQMATDYEILKQCIDGKEIVAAQLVAGGGKTVTGIIGMRIMQNLMGKKDPATGRYIIEPAPIVYVVPQDSLLAEILEKNKDAHQLLKLLFDGDIGKGFDVIETVEQRMVPGRITYISLQTLFFKFISNPGSLPSSKIAYIWDEFDKYFFLDSDFISTQPRSDVPWIRQLSRTAVRHTLEKIAENIDKALGMENKNLFMEISKRIQDDPACRTPEDVLAKFPNWNSLPAVEQAYLKQIITAVYRARGLYYDQYPEHPKSRTNDVFRMAELDIDPKTGAVYMKPGGEIQKDLKMNYEDNIFLKLALDAIWKMDEGYFKKEEINIKKIELNISQINETLMKVGIPQLMHETAGRIIGLTGTLQESLSIIRPLLDQMSSLRGRSWDCFFFKSWETFPTFTLNKDNIVNFLRNPGSYTKEIADIYAKYAKDKTALGTFKLFVDNVRVNEPIIAGNKLYVTVGGEQIEYAYTERENKQYVTIGNKEYEYTGNILDVLLRAQLDALPPDIAGRPPSTPELKTVDYRGIYVSPDSKIPATRKDSLNLAAAETVKQIYEIDKNTGGITFKTTALLDWNMLNRADITILREALVAAVKDALGGKQTVLVDLDGKGQKSLSPKEFIDKVFLADIDAKGDPVKMSDIREAATRKGTILALSWANRGTDFGWKADPYIGVLGFTPLKANLVQTVFRGPRFKLGAVVDYYISAEDIGSYLNMREGYLDIKIDGQDVNLRNSWNSVQEQCRNVPAEEFFKQNPAFLNEWQNLQAQSVKAKAQDVEARRLLMAEFLRQNAEFAKYEWPRIQQAGKGKKDFDPINEFFRQHPDKLAAWQDLPKTYPETVFLNQHPELAAEWQKFQKQYYKDPVQEYLAKYEGHFELIEARKASAMNSINIDNLRDYSLIYAAGVKDFAEFYRLAMDKYIDVCISRFYFACPLGQKMTAETIKRGIENLRTALAEIGLWHVNPLFNGDYKRLVADLEANPLEARNIIRAFIQEQKGSLPDTNGPYRQEMLKALNYRSISEAISEKEMREFRRAGGDTGKYTGPGDDRKLVFDFKIAQTVLKPGRKTAVYTPEMLQNSNTLPSRIIVEVNSQEDLTTLKAYYDSLNFRQYPGLQRVFEQNIVIRLGQNMIDRTADIAQIFHIFDPSVQISAAEQTFRVADIARTGPQALLEAILPKDVKGETVFFVSWTEDTGAARQINGVYTPPEEKSIDLRDCTVQMERIYQAIEQAINLPPRNLRKYLKETLDFYGIEAKAIDKILNWTANNKNNLSTLEMIHGTDEVVWFTAAQKAAASALNVDVEKVEAVHTHPTRGASASESDIRTGSSHVLFRDRTGELIFVQNTKRELYVRTDEQGRKIYAPYPTIAQESSPTMRTRAIDTSVLVEEVDDLKPAETETKTKTTISGDVSEDVPRTSSIDGNGALKFADQAIAGLSQDIAIGLSEQSMLPSTLLGIQALGEELASSGRTEEITRYNDFVREVTADPYLFLLSEEIDRLKITDPSAKLGATLQAYNNRYQTIAGAYKTEFESKGFSIGRRLLDRLDETRGAFLIGLAMSLKAEITDKTRSAMSFTQRASDWVINIPQNTGFGIFCSFRDNILTDASLKLVNWFAGTKLVDVPTLARNTVIPNRDLRALGIQPPASSRLAYAKGCGQYLLAVAPALFAAGFATEGVVAVMNNPEYEKLALSADPYDQEMFMAILLITCMTEGATNVLYELPTILSMLFPALAGAKGVIISLIRTGGGVAAMQAGGALIRKNITDPLIKYACARIEQKRAENRARGIADPPPLGPEEIAHKFNLLSTYSSVVKNTMNKAGSAFLTRFLSILPQKSLTMLGNLGLKLTAKGLGGKGLEMLAGKCLAVAGSKIVTKVIPVIGWVLVGIEAADWLAGSIEDVFAPNPMKLSAQAYAALDKTVSLREFIDINRFDGVQSLPFEVAQQLERAGYFQQVHDRLMGEVPEESKYEFEAMWQEMVGALHSGSITALRDFWQKAWVIGSLGRVFDTFLNGGVGANFGATGDGYVAIGGREAINSSSKFFEAVMTEAFKLFYTENVDRFNSSAELLTSTDARVRGAYDNYLGLLSAADRDNAKMAWGSMFTSFMSRTDLTVPIYPGASQRRSAVSQVDKEAAFLEYMRTQGITIDAADWTCTRVNTDLRTVRTAPHSISDLLMPNGLFAADKDAFVDFVQWLAFECKDADKYIMQYDPNASSYVYWENTVLPKIIQLLNYKGPGRNGYGRRDLAADLAREIIPLLSGDSLFFDIDAALQKYLNYRLDQASAFSTQKDRQTLKEQGAVWSLSRANTANSSAFIEDTLKVLDHVSGRTVLDTAEQNRLRAVIAYWDEQSEADKVFMRNYLTGQNRVAANLRSGRIDYVDLLDKVSVGRTTLQVLSEIDNMRAMSIACQVSREQNGFTAVSYFTQLLKSTDIPAAEWPDKLGLFLYMNNLQEDSLLSAGQTIFINIDALPSWVIKEAEPEIKKRPGDASRDISPLAVAETLRLAREITGTREIRNHGQRGAVIRREPIYGDYKYASTENLLKNIADQERAAVYLLSEQANNNIVRRFAFGGTPDQRISLQMTEGTVMRPARVAASMSNYNKVRGEMLARGLIAADMQAYDVIQTLGAYQEFRTIYEDADRKVPETIETLRPLALKLGITIPQPPTAESVYKAYAELASAINAACGRPALEIDLLIVVLQIKKNIAEDTRVKDKKSAMLNSLIVMGLFNNSATLDLAESIVALMDNTIPVGPLNVDGIHSGASGEENLDALLVLSGIITATEAGRHRDAFGVSIDWLFQQNKIENASPEKLTDLAKNLYLLHSTLSNSGNLYRWKIEALILSSPALLKTMLVHGYSVFIKDEVVDSRLGYNSYRPSLERTITALRNQDPFAVACADYLQTLLDTHTGIKASRQTGATATITQEQWETAVNTEFTGTDGPRKGEKYRLVNGRVYWHNNGVYQASASITVRNNQYYVNNQEYVIQNNQLAPKNRAVLSMTLVLDGQSVAVSGFDARLSEASTSLRINDQEYPLGTWVPGRNGRRFTYNGRNYVLRYENGWKIERLST